MLQMRYVNLSSVLVYRLVSQKVMDRFPDYDSLVQAELMLPHEVARLVKIDCKQPNESSFTPILWAIQLLSRARREEKIEMEAVMFNGLLGEFKSKSILIFVLILLQKNNTTNQLTTEMPKKCLSFRKVFQLPNKTSHNNRLLKIEKYF